MQLLMVNEACSSKFRSHKRCTRLHFQGGRASWGGCKGEGSSISCRGAIEQKRDCQAGSHEEAGDSVWPLGY